ncbi:hypothetical protein [Ferruginibacter sp.]
MKKAAIIICIAAVVLMGYGYWGAFTAAGNKVYDEMDGNYPFFILLGGFILLLIALGMFLLGRRKAGK